MGVKTIIGAELESSTVEGIVTDAKYIIDRRHDSKMQDEINEELYQQINNILSKLTGVNLLITPSVIVAGILQTVNISIDSSNVADSVSIYRDGIKIHTDETVGNHWIYQDSVLPQQYGTINYKVEVNVSGSVLMREGYIDVVRQQTNILWSSETATVTIGKDNQFPTLQNAEGLDIHYTSSNENVATIDQNGTVTLVSPGNATITASFGGNDSKAGSSDSYALLVRAGINYKTVRVGSGSGDYDGIIIERDTGNLLSDNMIEQIDINRDGNHIFVIVDSEQTVKNLYTYPGPNMEQWEFPIQLQDRGVHDGYRYYRSISAYDASSFNYKINKTL